MPRVALISYVALAALACGNETRVQLVLAPDPEINPAADVAAALERIQVVVDAADGLRAPSESDGEAVDWDQDGEIEVVLTSPPLDGAELPVLQIGVSSNAGRDLEYRVLGFPANSALAADTAVALGGVTHACARGNTCRVGAPFNLRASARPPRVVTVAPPDGIATVPPNLAYVAVVFSTTVDEETVASNVTFVGTLGHEPATTAIVQEVLYESERRSLLQLSIEEDLNDEPYVLTVSPGIVGANGREFDQDPTTKAEDGFVATFGTERGVGTFGCPDGYEEGVDGCEPSGTCLLHGCPDGYVCGGVGCIEDCRVFGACAQPGATCSADTGLCE
jgi:hypothetical protein